MDRAQQPQNQFQTQYLPPSTNISTPGRPARRAQNFDLQSSNDPNDDLEQDEQDPDSDYDPSPGRRGSTGSNVKRNREDETPSQRLKREKAAERQRRKRERDRAANAAASAASMNVHQPQYNPNNASPNEQQMSPEEISRRDRVRAAARERQRKHRAMVKARKMRELGMDMGNEVLPPGADQHPGVHPHDAHPGMMPGGPDDPMAPYRDYAAMNVLAAGPGGLQHAVQPPVGHMYPNGYPLPMGLRPLPGMMPGVPQQPGQEATPQAAGEIFAATLLLSLSLVPPMLKQHLISTLNISNEELATLEPAIAAAYADWDSRRRAAAAGDASGSGAASTSSQADAKTGAPQASVNNGAASYTEDPNAANEFRARFHRPLVAPSPFAPQPAQPQIPAHPPSNVAAHHTPSNAGTPSSTGQVADAEGAIDPHLNGSPQEAEEDGGVKPVKRRRK